MAATLVATPFTTLADSYNVTVAAGHPPVFRWIKMISEVYIPTVTAELEAAGHSITLSLIHI